MQHFEDFIVLTKFAEKAGRFKDMVAYMESALLKTDSILISEHWDLFLLACKQRANQIKKALWNIQFVS